jgi:hypothetical protein
MTNRGRPWTKEELEQLKILMIEHRPWTEIAKILNRGIRACMNNWYKRKTKNPLDYIKRPWTKEEIEQLINLRKQNKTSKEISKILNRTIQSCQTTFSNIIRKTNLNYLPKHSKPVGWTQQEIELLIELKRRYKSRDYIAKQLNRSVSSCSQKSRRLKIRTPYKRELGLAKHQDKSYLKQYAEQYRKTNKDKLKKQALEYILKNKEKINKTRKLYYEKNKTKMFLYKTQYDKQHLVKARLWKKKSRIKHFKIPGNKIKKNLRQMMKRLILKQNVNKYYSSNKLIGCDTITLRKHIENQFKEGMTWENHGKWHIDHIIPCSKFDLIDPINQKICFNYRNLQPLWARDNIIKNNKILNPEHLDYLKKEILGEIQ